MEQKISKIIGESGCYFTCLCKFAGKENDIISIYKKSLALGYIEEDCYIKDPVKILKMLTGKNYSVVKQSTALEADLIITRFVNKRTGFNHFAITDVNAKVLYDPLGDSVTVKEGYAESFRMFVEIK